MSNFERPLGNSREEKSYSSPVNLEYDHHTNLCYGISRLNKELETSIKHPDKARAVYEHASSPSSDTSFDLDTIYQDNELQSLGITIYGGTMPYNASYHYSHALGGFVETTNASSRQHLVENANLVRMLSDQFPEIVEVQKLLDRPIDSPEMIDRALIGFAQENATSKVRSTRYSSHDFTLGSLGIEYPRSDYTADRKTELIATNINDHAIHYQLDIDAPYEVDTLQFRRAVNYQFQHDSVTAHPIATCTSRLMTQHDMTREHCRGYMKIQPEDAYENLLQGLRSLKHSAEL